jgi:hypothetical protein
MHGGNQTFGAGIASLGTVHPRTIAVTATDASGGQAPYTYQWQISTNGGGTWSNATGTGVTTRSATLKGITHPLRPHHTYLVRLLYTDSMASLSASNVLTVTTHWAPRYFGRPRA